jgi:hypothetical protein
LFDADRLFARAGGFAGRGRGGYSRSMDLSALQALLASLNGVRVVCVGDLMVDRFV